MLDFTVTIKGFTYTNHSDIIILDTASKSASTQEQLAILDDMGRLYVVWGYVDGNELSIYPDSPEKPVFAKGQTIRVKEVQPYE